MSFLTMCRMMAALPPGKENASGETAAVSVPGSPRSLAAYADMASELTA